MIDEANRPPLFLLGVDGGGSGTRACLAAAERPEQTLGRGTAGPSGLAHGVAAAWRAIESAARMAFDDAGEVFAWHSVYLACGLAGMNHPDWRVAFEAAAPRLRGFVAVSDAYTTVLGVHAGAPGIVIALGTGSVGLSLDADGHTHAVGGWGFPSGDEASGAWLGLQAIRHAQQALDGRVAPDALSEALLSALGSHSHEALQRWLSEANQTAYASLAPVVVAHAEHPRVRGWLDEAARETIRMAEALDPDAQAPVALSGSLAPFIGARLPAPWRERLRPAKGGSVDGALWLAARLAHAG